jgi:hypothetical protein
MKDSVNERRDFLKAGALGLAGGALAAGAGMTLNVQQAVAVTSSAAPAAPTRHGTSRMRTAT